MRKLGVILFVLAACGGKKTSPTIDATPSPFCTAKHGSQLTLVPIASGLDGPIYLTAPKGDPRIFVVERPGRIRLIGADGQLRPTPYLDISSKTSQEGERGLLGLAFHGDFATTGKFYIFYTHIGDGSEMIDEYTVDPNAEVVTSQPRNLITQTDPANNHNGGTVAWGPVDNYLYFGIGDGGGGDDQFGNGQNMNTLMAKISRIDPDHPANGKPYGIPADNPWANGPGVPEMYVWGLRNPYRFSIDDDGTLYIGDVGQNKFEELDVVTPAQKGENLGWSIFEANDCHAADPAQCTNATGLTPPTYDYDRRNATPNQCAVMGGFVYRGACMPDLAGQYFWGDWCSGEVDTFTAAGGALTNLVKHTEIDPDQNITGNLPGFGKDGFGEVYALALAHGGVYRIEAR
jgi:glucose/arabinose dehydrogenase